MLFSGIQQSDSVIYIYIYIHIYTVFYIYIRASQVALVVKNLPASVGDVRDTSSIPG